MKKASLAILIAILATCAVSAQDTEPPKLSLDNALWQLELGTHQYAVPKMDRGRLFIGVNDLGLKHPVFKSTGGGLLKCLDPASGETIWRLVIPRYVEGVIAPYHFNHWKCGICSSPVIEGDRVWIVGSRGEVLCADRDGQANGNDGPFLDELRYCGAPEGSDAKLAPSDGDIIWKYNLITELDVYPHDVCGSTLLLHGDVIYANTSNGQDDKHRDVPNPKAPSLIALHKRTGRLLAVENENTGERLFHGNWSSPILATDKTGNPLIVFGCGDGILYAFAPADPNANTPGTLKKVWSYDCNPTHYRQRDGKPVPYSKHNNKSSEGPSDIISTPVFHNGRVYVGIGQSPIHGKGQGMLSCVDASTGKRVWDSPLVERTLSEVAIADGLLYICDYSERLHCFNADTGEHYWTQELEQSVWHCSPVVVGDEVHVGTEKGLYWVMQAGREKKVLSKTRLKSPPITPVVSDGVLYLPTQRWLYALPLAKK